jgi:RHS repeat-associated protein
MCAWDSRGHALRTEYDALRRPLRKFVSGDDSAQTDVRVRGREVLFEAMEYGEGQANDSALNLRTHLWKLRDGGGVLTTEACDFKGNVLRSVRQLARDYKAVPDWSGVVPLEDDLYASSTIFDALNRPVTVTSPDGSVIRRAYNEANLLERIDASLRGEQLDGEPVWTPFVEGIQYNSKGQRERIDYGSGVSTSYTYDPLTFRLTRLVTQRSAAAFPEDCPADPPQEWPGCAVQNLHYIHDPAGNVTYIRDDAQQTIFFRNRRVEPSCDYTYDALGQLIEATGREHLGQNGGIPNAPSASDAFDSFHAALPQPSDGNAMGRYLQSYIYDAVGNILTIKHRGSDPVNPGWTRAYTYTESSLIESGQINNRLSTTQVGAAPIERYAYDAHGNMTAMPHLPEMQWTFLDQLMTTSQQVVNDGTPQTTYYTYDASGQRLRKVTERLAASGNTPSKAAERIYLGTFEIYHEYGAGGSTATLTRETLHIADNQRRIALVETRTQGDDGSPPKLIRYVFDNHLGSVGIELDEAGRLISYEEYFPHGSTSYQACDSSLRAAAKRYRYTGKEKDEETGLTYHGARYYAPWLGRWTSADPAGISEHPNLYVSVVNNPLRYVDANGATSGFHESSQTGVVDRIIFAVEFAHGYGTEANATNTGLMLLIADPRRQWAVATTAAREGLISLIYRGPLETLNRINPITQAYEGYERAQSAYLAGDADKMGRETFHTVLAGSSVLLIAAGAAPAAGGGSAAADSVSLLSGSSDALALSMPQIEAIPILAADAGTSGLPPLAGGIAMFADNASSGDSPGEPPRPEEGPWRTEKGGYKNLLDELLEEELEIFSEKGGRVFKPGEHGFDELVASGAEFKWGIIEETGELVITAKWIGEYEAPHSVLAEGRALTAAGEGQGAWLSNHSGHYFPGDETLTIGANEFYRQAEIIFFELRSAGR